MSEKGYGDILDAMAFHLRQLTGIQAIESPHLPPGHALLVSRPLDLLPIRLPLHLAASEEIEVPAHYRYLDLAMPDPRKMISIMGIDLAETGRQRWRRLQGQRRWLREKMQRQLDRRSSVRRAKRARELDRRRGAKKS
jgi:hypothetical protein